MTSSDASETLGYGTCAGNAIKFNFEYLDGPFHNTFTWFPETKSWVATISRPSEVQANPTSDVLSNVSRRGSPPVSCVR
jgi:hypothetical protein